MGEACSQSFRKTWGGSFKHARTKLEDAFTLLQWMHDSPELNDRNFMKTKFPKMTPREIVLGKRRQRKRLANKKSRIVEVPERFYYVSLLASIEAQLRNRRILDKNMKKYGVHRILQPFVEELQILGGDLGHHFDIHGGTITGRNNRINLF